MIAEQPGMSDELSRIAYRPEPLVVKIVGQSVTRERLNIGCSAVDVSDGHVAEDKLETVPTKVIRPIRL